jgi:hypothetical protein
MMHRLVENCNCAISHKTVEILIEDWESAISVLHFPDETGLIY